MELRGELRATTDPCSVLKSSMNLQGKKDSMYKPHFFSDLVNHVISSNDQFLSSFHNLIVSYRKLPVIKYRSAMYHFTKDCLCDV